MNVPHCSSLQSSSRITKLIREHRDELNNITLNESIRDGLTRYLDDFEKENSGTKQLSFVSSSDLNLLPENLQKISSKIALELENEEVPTNYDIEELYSAMEISSHLNESERTISFEGLIVCLETLPSRIKKTLQPALLFRAHANEWPLPADFRINIDVIHEFIQLKSALIQYRITLSYYDEGCTGFLTEEQFIGFSKEYIMPSIPSLKDNDSTFLDCYMHTYLTMFFFFLDPLGSKKISILHIVISGLLESVSNVQGNSADLENWFSVEKTQELIETFNKYSKDENGTLSIAEFRQAHEYTGFTDAFIRRIFEVHAKLTGKMSYEEYVVFSIAFGHLNHPSSLSYFFKMLDIDDDGFLTPFELNYFYKDLRPAFDQYVTCDGAMPKFDDFASQLFDMVGNGLDQRVPLSNLIKCKQGHEFTRCLINYKDFYAYEMREGEEGQSSEDDTIADFILNNEEEEDFENGSEKLVDVTVDENNNSEVGKREKDDPGESDQ